MNCLPSALCLAAVKINPVLTSERYLIMPPSGLCGNDAVMMSSSYAFLPAARCSGVSFGVNDALIIFSSNEILQLALSTSVCSGMVDVLNHNVAIEIAKLW